MTKENTLPIEEFILRDTEIYTLDDTSIDLNRPERIRLDLELPKRKTPFDIGAICYTKRERLIDDRVAIRNRPDSVVLTSFRRDRRELVRAILDELIVTGSRRASAFDYLRGYVFLCDWCDGNDHTDFLSSSREAKVAYKEFVEWLHNSIVTSKRMSPRTGNDRQNRFIRMMRLVFEKRETAFITRNIPTIPCQKNQYEPPEKESVKYYANVCLALSQQLSRAMINKELFPLKLEMADYSTYIFPSKGRNIRTPFTQNAFRTYNFDEGRIATVYEHFNTSKTRNKSNSVKSIADAEKLLTQANLDNRHEHRMNLASLAMQAYTGLFVLITGANPSQFISLEYDDALALVRSPVKKELISVKFRAAGKAVRLPIGGKRGIRILKEYFELREWVLDGRSCRWLFFSLSRNAYYTGEVEQLAPDFQFRFFDKRLKGKYLPSRSRNISPSAARTFKSVVLHSLKISPSVVAGVLGHSEV